MKSNLTPTKFTPKIVSVNYLHQFVLEICFANQEVKNIDFEPFLQSNHHPDVRAFLDIPKFKQFQIQHGNLIWGDYEMIFPLEDLYNNSLLKNEVECS